MDKSGCEPSMFFHVLEVWYSILWYGTNDIMYNRNFIGQNVTYRDCRDCMLDVTQLLLLYCVTLFNELCADYQ